MTRFQRDLNGEFGAYWKAEAERALAKVKADLESGEITIDENGAARNCIGRALMDDLLEQLAMVSTRVDTGATQAARKAEDSAFLAEYRKNPPRPDLAELRAAFGAGTTVVDIITGEKIEL